LPFGETIGVAGYSYFLGTKTTPTLLVQLETV